MSSSRTIADSKSQPYLERIQLLAKGIQDHAALKNGMYDLWMSQRLSGPQMRVFCVNYFHWIYPTVQRLALALSTVTDWESRLELAQNLNDELGNGELDKVHVFLMRRWLNALLEKCGEKELDPFGEDRALVTPATDRLTTESLLLSGGDPATASGAVLAQEWHAYYMLIKLLEGYQLYKPLYDLVEFHDLGEYLYIHVGAAEKEHMRQSIVQAASNCKNEDDFQKLQRGFVEFLILLSDFWNNLLGEITNSRALAA